MLRLVKATLIALGLTFSIASMAEAAELVMIDSPACSYCQRFKRDILPSYAASALGKRAPLRSVNVWRRWPEDLRAVKPERFTPVFILVEHGREVGRMYGYKGKVDFWGRLEVLLRYL